MPQKQISKHITQISCNVTYINVIVFFSPSSFYGVFCSFSVLKKSRRAPSIKQVYRKFCEPSTVEQASSLHGMRTSGQASAWSIPVKKPSQESSEAFNDLQELQTKDCKLKVCTQCQHTLQSGLHSPKLCRRELLSDTLCKEQRPAPPLVSAWEQPCDGGIQENG